MKNKTYQLSVKELPTFYSGLCYVVEFQRNFNDTDALSEMTVTVEKINMDMEIVKVWITPEYDYLDATHQDWGIFLPFKFSVPFGGFRTTQVSLIETVIKPLKCQELDTNYKSRQQCLVKIYFSEEFSPCPTKCLPIQMKGFKYINNSTSITNCGKLEDEICNGGPQVWSPLLDKFVKCLNPCRFSTYIDSGLELVEMLYLKPRKTRASFELVVNTIRRVEKERLVYDTNDMIAAIGGSLGLFLGLSFFNVVSKCLDNLFNLISSYHLHLHLKS